MIKNELIDALESKFNEIGIKKGDTIQFSIDLTRLILLAMREHGYSDKSGRDRLLFELTDCLKHVVGDEGTILVPSFTWKFNDGIEYRRKDSPSEVGAYSNWLLNHDCGFVRTRHPVHSFLVWGNEIDYYTRLDNTDSWGDDSPFARFANSDAKLVVYDMPTVNTLTIFHYVEEKNKVPYKYTKYFKGRYVDYDGVVSERVISMYVRDLDIVPEWYYNFEESFFRELKSAVYTELMGQSIAAFSFRDIACALEDDLKNNSGKKCIKIDGFSLDMNANQTHPDDLSAILA